MSKKSILNYCSQFSMASAEHIEHAIENKRMIEKGEYRYLNGCPSSFGMPTHIGLCETEEYQGLTQTTKEQEDMCEKCWKLALEVK